MQSFADCNVEVKDMSIPETSCRMSPAQLSGSDSGKRDWEKLKKKGAVLQKEGFCKDYAVGDDFLLSGNKLGTE